MSATVIGFLAGLVYLCTMCVLRAGLFDDRADTERFVAALIGALAFGVLIGGIA